jgi:hypothetical protein
MQKRAANTCLPCPTNNPPICPAMSAMVNIEEHVTCSWVEVQRPERQCEVAIPRTQVVQYLPCPTKTDFDRATAPTQAALLACNPVHSVHECV